MNNRDKLSIGQPSRSSSIRISLPLPKKTIELSRQTQKSKVLLLFYSSKPTTTKYYPSISYLGTHLENMAISIDKITKPNSYQITMYLGNTIISTPISYENHVQWSINHKKHRLAPRTNNSKWRNKYFDSMELTDSLKNLELNFIRIE